MGWKAELALGGWLVTYRNKCPAPGIEPGHGRHLSTNRARCRLTSLIEANALTTAPDHQQINQSINQSLNSLLKNRRTPVKTVTKR